MLSWLRSLAFGIFQGDDVDHTDDVEKTQVVCAVIKGADGRFFVCSRKSDVMAGKWEFPGGKVEPEEHPEVALVREVREELGISSSAGFVYCVVDLGDVSVTAYRVYPNDPFWERSLTLNAHYAYRWVTREEIVGIHDAFCVPSLKRIAEVLR